jgi:CO/xanthine dehydrogenase Mo-binding subunit
VKFDRARVSSVDWSSYPILTFAEVPKLDIELIDRPTEPRRSLPASQPVRPLALRS